MVEGDGARRPAGGEARQQADNLLRQDRQVVHERDARTGVQDARGSGQGPPVPERNPTRLRAGTVGRDGGNRGRVGRGNFRLELLGGVFVCGFVPKVRKVSYNEYI